MLCPCSREDGARRHGAYTANLTYSHCHELERTRKAILRLLTRVSISYCLIPSITFTFVLVIFTCLLHLSAVFIASVSFFFSMFYYSLHHFPSRSLLIFHAACYREAPGFEILPTWLQYCHAHFVIFLSYLGIHNLEECHSQFLPDPSKIEVNVIFSFLNRHLYL